MTKNVSIFLKTTDDVMNDKEGCQQKLAGATFLLQLNTRLKRVSDVCYPKSSQNELSNVVMFVKNMHTL